MVAPLHEDELPISDALVRRLVDTQLPEHRGRALVRLSESGSSNVLFRLGPDLVVRLPRQPGGSESIRKEATWGPFVGAALPVPTPEVVALGEPAYGYSEQWSVVRWLSGEHPAADRGPDGREELAHDLASVVRGLRRLEVPPDARHDASLRWYRADPLALMDGEFREYVEDCRAIADLELDLDAVLAVWEHSLTVGAEPAADDTLHWLHGDLLAENLLVQEGRLAAVLDLGGLAVGDPTVDLAVAWELLDGQSRQLFRAEVGVDDRSWLIGRAWALTLAVMTFPYYWRTMPDRCQRRLVMAHRVLEDAERLPNG